jgi:hypothetical protein
MNFIDFLDNLPIAISKALDDERRMLRSERIRFVENPTYYVEKESAELEQAAWTAESGAKARELADRRLAIKVSELVWREKFDKFLADIDEWRVSKPLSDANAKLDRARAEITKKLLSLGYLANVEGEAVTLPNLMIELHPSVKEARDAVNQLRDTSMLPMRGANKLEIEKLKRETEVGKAKTLAA